MRAQGSEDTAPTIHATTREQSGDELRQSVQEATFRYFWHGGHPVSGMAREGIGTWHPDHLVATGATGMGLMAIVVGAERGFVSRSTAAERTLRILTFMGERADRFHGVWPHWLNGETGATIPFSDMDDGGDLVETALFIQGVLVARQYFDGEGDVEEEIRRRAARLWRAVEWDHHLRDGVLLWHWSPNHGFAMNHAIRGFNETQITYVLAVASPTHSVPPTTYETGWLSPWYDNGGDFYGIRLAVGPDLGGPMFWTHYSYLGFDPRGWTDGHADYFEHGRHVARIHRAYAADNPLGHEGYSDECWGLTASLNPWGYAAHEPGTDRDNGTIAPTAALSSMPYTPEASMAALRHFYHDHGQRLWGPFGFRDAFNVGEDWYAPGYLGIDQAPIVVMIENHRSGLIWETFMSSPEIEPALLSMGWTR
ncbi:MAG: beta-glucosidase [Armatimonadia bacterium]|nr:beta-glucosidase [Armatimonadia bacterium]